ncbi:MAG: FkbM family methyltransferase [Gemmataceae bacterium]
MQAIHQLCQLFDLNPILIDVGASGAPPKIWDSIASRSTYVGFDPDLREIRETTGGHFARSIIVNEAVTASAEGGKTRFYFTKSPYCSSTLRPSHEPLQNQLFAELFEIKSEAEVSATTLEAVLARLNLDRVDWLKIDSQGTDLRIVEAIPDIVGRSILALDVEPGLIDAYEGEDHFVTAHSALVNQGYWLANLEVCGTVRMRQSTLKHILATYPEVNYFGLERGLPTAPGWCNATYLRTLESLASNEALRPAYAMLWLFAVLHNQIGFALDVALEIRSLFGDNELSTVMENELVPYLEQACQAHMPKKASLARRFLRRVQSTLFVKNSK